MENNRKTRKAWLIGLLLLSWAFAIYLVGYTQQLKGQVAGRDQLLKEGSKADSAKLAVSKQYADTISKYMDNCALNINGKTYGTDDLIKLLKNYIYEKQILETMVDSLVRYGNANGIRAGTMADSLRMYKRIAQLAEERLNTKFSLDKYPGGFVVKSEVKLPEGGYDTAFINRKIIEMIKRDFNIAYSVKGMPYDGGVNYHINLVSGPPTDSTRQLQKVLQLAHKYYSLNYKVREEGKLTYYDVKTPVLDSALALFPFFRHMLVSDRDGHWVVRMSGKNFRVARKKDLSN